MKKGTYKFSAEGIPACHFGTIVTLKQSYLRSECQFQHRSYQDFLCTFYLKQQHDSEDTSASSYLPNEEIQFLKKNPDLCQYVCGVLGNTAISLVSELMNIGMSKPNGDDAWLACLHEAVECRNELDSYERKQYKQYKSALYKSIYDKIISQMSKKSISCSSRHIMTLTSFVGKEPTHQVWKNISRVALDCRYESIMADKRESKELSLH